MNEHREPQFLRNTKNQLAHIEARGRNFIRQHKREAFEERKKEVVDRQKQMSELIAGLYEKAYQSGNGNQADLLFALVKDHEKVYGQLDEESSEVLMHALNQYSIKHDRVGYYYRQYAQQPELLFEKCFGEKPKGQVQLILGPMTLCFRCFDEEDYITAYVSNKHEDEKPQSSEDLRGKAKRSQGVAFYSVKEADLVGSVIMEKASNNFMFIKRFNTIEVDLQKNRLTSINFGEFDADGKLWWKIGDSVPYAFDFMLGEDGKITGVNLFDNKKGDFIFFDKPVSPPSSFRLEIEGEKFKQTEFVDILLNREGINLIDHSRKRHTIEFQKYAGKKKVVKDEKFSKSIRRHEEQHQFNKLFVPKEEYMGIPSGYIESMEKMMYSYDEKEAKTAKQKIIQTLARHYRRMYIDARARDEIIAYYKDGSDLETIASTLKTSPLYDYAADELEFTNKTKKTYHAWIEDLVYSDLGSGEYTQNITYSPSRSKLHYQVHIPLMMPINKGEFERGEVMATVADVLTEDYSKSIDRWLNQIGKLEEMGYERQQIIAFLNMLPARGWEGFVRRLRKNIREEDEKRQSNFERPTEQEIKDLAIYWSHLKKSDRSEYDYVLSQIMNVATKDVSAESDLVERYRGWQIEDFEELFRLLGEDQKKLLEQKNKNLANLAELSMQEKARITVERMSNPNYVPEDYLLPLDEIVKIMADYPNFEEDMMEALAPGGKFYVFNPAQSDKLREQIIKKLTFELRKRAASK